MSGYLYKDFIGYIYNNPLIILIYSLVLSVIILFINKVKPVLYIIVLLIIVSLGCCLFTNNLLYFLLGIEAYSLLYLLLLYNTSSNNDFLIEVRKLSLLSMVISCIMVFGTTLILINNYNLYFNNISVCDLLNKLGLSFILVGILFKLCVFPFHIWILDIYKKSSYYIVLLTDCFLKLILLRVLLQFTSVFQINSFNIIYITLGIISMFLGIILSIKENNIKRFFGLFNISHIGLILLLVSINNTEIYTSVLGYLLMYSMCLLVFLLSIKDNIKNFREFKKNNNINRIMYITNILVLLAMICIPPFHTFLSKIDLILMILKNKEYTVLILSTMYFIIEMIVVIIKLRFIINNIRIQSSYRS